MKLLVIGATGGTGLHLLQEAVGQGHEVTALVRSPEKVTFSDDNLKVVTGDILCVDDLTSSMCGCDAVLSAVGGRPGMYTPCSVYSQSVKTTTEAMRKAGVKRYIGVTAWGTKDDPGLPFIWRWVLKPSMMRNVVGDMEKAEDFLLEHCSDINYTVVRPPRLTKLPSEGGAVQVAEGQCVTGVTASAISRQDLAMFLLTCLTETKYDGKMIAVIGPDK